MLTRSKMNRFSDILKGAIRHAIDHRMPIAFTSREIALSSRGTLTVRDCLDGFSEMADYGKAELRDGKWWPGFTVRHHGPEDLSGEYEEVVV